MLALKNVPLNSWILLNSSQGYGLSLFFKDSESLFPHGDELLNRFSLEYEFHHWKHNDDDLTQCVIIESKIAEQLINMKEVKQLF